uniref:RING-type domain-containing protein n=1 Tax=Globodera rostochiensis TaxID=31243 RepID=A0A914HGI1_GLORO
MTTANHRICPKCKTSEFQNRSLVMMLNECCHPLCQNCVENLFARNVAPCPYEGCGKMLKRSGFWTQQEDDFATLREFNDYLERVEEIVFRLVNELKVEETEQEMHTFKEEFAEAIERNRRRPTKDDLWVKAMLDEEMARRSKVQEDNSERRDRSGSVKFNPKAIIEELRSSDLPAEVVLDRQRKKRIEQEMADKEEMIRRKRDKQEEKLRAKERATFGVIRPSGKPYYHSQPTLFLNGPPVPGDEELERSGCLQFVRQAPPSSVAGGYLARIGCTRAILEAHADLLNSL